MMWVPEQIVADFPQMQLWSHLTSLYYFSRIKVSSSSENYWSFFEDCNQLKCSLVLKIIDAF